MTMQQDYTRQRSDSSGMPWMDALKREVRAEVAGELKELRKQVSDLTSKLAGRQTNVSVAAPSVSVAAPSVSVAPASVEVEVDLGELKKSMDGMAAALKENSRILMLPVTRTVHRKTDNLIDTMTEKRG